MSNGVQDSPAAAPGSTLEADAPTGTGLNCLPSIVRTSRLVNASSRRWVRHYDCTHLTVSLKVNPCVLAGLRLPCAYA
jgi:hypothetical protein